MLCLLVSNETRGRWFASVAHSAPRPAPRARFARVRVMSAYGAVAPPPPRRSSPRRDPPLVPERRAPRGGTRKKPGNPTARRLARLRALLHRHILKIWFAYVLFSCWFLRALLLDEHDRDNRHTWTDALYFCAVTILTIGYGDVRPTTPAGKLYVIFFILVAACLASVFLSHVSEWILDAQDRASQIISRKNERAIRVDVAELRERIESNQAGRSPSASEAGRSATSAPPDTPRSTRSNASAADVAAEVAEEEKAELEDRPKRPVAKALTVVATFTVVGALCMMRIERLSATDAFYWAVVTITTVGYGDITPETDKGRLFVVFFATCAVATVAWAVATLAETAVVATMEATAEEKLAAARITPEYLAKVGGEKGYVTEMDFMKATLVQLGKCDERDFRMIETRFAELDANGDKTLSIEDLVGDMDQLAADLADVLRGEREREREKG